MDAHKLGTREQQRLIFPHHARDLVHLAAGHIEIEVLAADLNIRKLGERHADERAAGLERQPLLRLLLAQVEPVKQGEELFGRDGLEQILKRLHAVAFIGKTRRGGEEDNIRRTVKGADLMRRGHAARAGHHHVQQVERKALLRRRVQQFPGAVEQLPVEHRTLLLLPRAQEGLNGLQLLDLVVTDRNIHRAHLPCSVLD